MYKSKLNTKKSEELFNRAVELIPGGVNSPVRSFKSVNMSPLFISRGDGPFIFDADGNRYLDFVNSWGALILGHRFPSVICAIEESLKNGLTFGASHEKEIELAYLITQRVPSVEKVRLVNSGTEAVMTAIRLARAYTNKSKIIKFAGCYHGHADPMLSMSGSGLATHGIPSSSGVPKSIAFETITVPYNDIASLEVAMSKYADDIACVILEPIVGNSGVIIPADGFLKQAGALCEKYKCVYIFDEVMTGFRVSYGGAQEIFNIVPDLTTFGKIIGGGMPIGAVGGKKEIMNLLAPCGSVYQAGTLSGNPVSVSCGIATLKELSKESYVYLNDLTRSLHSGIEKVNREKGFKFQVNSIGTMFSIFFTDVLVKDYESAQTSNTELFSKFFKSMLELGMYIAPSQFEANFLSTVHTKEHVESFVDAYSKSL